MNERTGWVSKLIIIQCTLHGQHVALDLGGDIRFIKLCNCSIACRVRLKMMTKFCHTYSDGFVLKFEMPLLKYHKTWVQADRKSVV